MKKKNRRDKLEWNDRTKRGRDSGYSSLTYEVQFGNNIQLTLVCSFPDSTTRRSTRDGLCGIGGTGRLLSLDTILPGFCFASSASTCETNKIYNEKFL